jgi:hypothetical protein
MDLRVCTLQDLDPRSVPLPHGTEVITRVDRIVGERRVPQGTVGRVTKIEGDLLEVSVIGVGVLGYAHAELSTRSVGNRPTVSRLSSRSGAVASVLALAGPGCAPSLPPFLSAETADVLPAKHVALAAGGGLTVLTMDVRTVGLCCGGEELRARIGIGSRQELSVTSAAATTDGVWALSSRLGWKAELAPWLAASAGGDLVIHNFSHRAVAVPGGDLGAVVSAPPFGRFPRTQPYGGARLGLYIPALADPFSGPGVVGTLSVPAGFAIHLTAATRLYVEGGFVAIHTWYRASPEVESYPLYGGYGAVALEVLFP